MQPTAWILGEAGHWYSTCRQRSNAGDSGGKRYRLWLSVTALSNNRSFSPAPGVTKVPYARLSAESKLLWPIGLLPPSPIVLYRCYTNKSSNPSYQNRSPAALVSIESEPKRAFIRIGRRIALRPVILSSMDSTALDLSQSCLSHSIDQIYLSFPLRFYCYQTETSTHTDARNIAGAGEGVNISHRDPGNSARPQYRRLSLWGLAWGSAAWKTDTCISWRIPIWDGLQGESEKVSARFATIHRWTRLGICDVHPAHHTCLSC